MIIQVYDPAWVRIFFFWGVFILIDEMKEVGKN